MRTDGHTQNAAPTIDESTTDKVRQRKTEVKVTASTPTGATMISSHCVLLSPSGDSILVITTMIHLPVVV